MPIHWKLKEYLDARDLSTYRLIKRSGLAQGTAYRLVNGDTRNLNAATLDAVVEALRSLTGEPVEIQDVLEYRTAVQVADDLEARTREWHDADLSRLGEFEPYEWGDVDPETVGEPLRLGDR